MHSIGPCYRQAVQDRQSRIIRETALAEEQGTYRIEAYADGATFILLIDRQTHIIHKAAHGGATSSVARALLDGLCELVEGLPIQEASDHGVIRLEAALFDPLARPPVPGVVTPESADPAFHLPLALIRGALRDYREVTRYQNLENEFDAGPSRAWLSLSEAEQRALLTQAFKLICQENGYSPGDILTVAIEHQVRVVVDLQGKLALGDKQQYMMKLEAGLQAKVDSRLELFLEELTDENKLRRLGQEE